MSIVDDLSGDDDFVEDSLSQLNGDDVIPEGFEYDCNEEITYIECTNTINYSNELHNMLSLLCTSKDKKKIFSVQFQHLVFARVGMEVEKDTTMKQDDKYLFCYVKYLQFIADKCKYIKLTYVLHPFLSLFGEPLRVSDFIQAFLLSFTISNNWTSLISSIENLFERFECVYTLYLRWNI